LKLVFAHIECASKIQRDIGRVVRAALAVFIRPISELTPLVGAFLGQLDHTLLHKPTFLDTFVVSLRDASQFATRARIRLMRVSTSRASPASG
jgi:hypothetical protein